jgi:fructose-bisphosphate aldolase, class I
VVALSGGYELHDACRRLVRNHDMIASFSRALLDGLKVGMSEAEFNATLSGAVEEIYRASTVKV